MQANFYVNKEQLGEFLKFIWECGPPQIYQGYSEYNCDILQFQDLESVLKHLQNQIEMKSFSESLRIHYPAAKGYLQTEKINIKSRRCTDTTFRYRIGGWGVINLHIDFKEIDKHGIECMMSCNSEKRAMAWFSTCKELKTPKLWDWKEVESISRKLRRFVKRYKMKWAVIEEMRKIGACPFDKLRTGGQSGDG